MLTHHVYKETKQTSWNIQKRRNMSGRLKQEEVDFSVATKEPVEQVKAREVVIMTVLTMLQTSFCLTLLIVEVSLQVLV